MTPYQPQRQSTKDIKPNRSDNTYVNNLINEMRSFNNGTFREKKDTLIRLSQLIYTGGSSLEQVLIN
jgi:hypothetical protein